MNKQIQLISTVTCPECGFSKEETMPTDSCPVSVVLLNALRFRKPPILQLTISGVGRSTVIYYESNLFVL
jgi:hypothetical protein